MYSGNSLKELPWNKDTSSPVLIPFHHLPPVSFSRASTAKRQREQVEDSMEAFWQYQAKKTKTNKKLQKLDHRENVKLKEELAKVGVLQYCNVTFSCYCGFAFVLVYL